MCAVPNMAVFSSSLISCFPGILLRNYLSYFEKFPVAPIINRFHFCFHIPHALNFNCKVLYFKIFWASFLITFLSPEIATSINMHVPFLLTRIIIIVIITIIVVVIRSDNSSAKKKMGLQIWYVYGRRGALTGTCWGKLRERHHSEDLGLDGRIILNRDFTKSGGRAWIGLIWLMKGTDSKRLWKQ